MTREEAITILIRKIDEDLFVRTEYREKIHEALKMAIKALEQQESDDFARWVAREIFDEMWEYNKDAFAEIACRKLAKLGIVRSTGHEWELVEQEPCEDAISRQDVLDLAKKGVLISNGNYESVCKAINKLPPANPRTKTGYISIDDVMSVFDDFMRGEVDEDGTDTFLKMLKDRAECEG